jgi:hypothetical protein
VAFPLAAAVDDEKTVTGVPLGRVCVIEVNDAETPEAFLQLESAEKAAPGTKFTAAHFERVSDENICI